MRKTKEQKGITLIALIITIIVLLILAVVAIGAVTNDGIINYAKNAREEYEKAGVNENTTLSEYLSKIEANLPNKNRTETGEEEKNPTKLTLSGDTEVEVKSTITLSTKLDIGEVDTSKLQWTSSNPEVATVKDGIVTGVNATKGKTTITATYNNTLKDEIEIKVNPKLLGNCTNCKDGVIKKYKCPDCGVMNSKYELGGLYVKECSECMKITSKWVDSMEFYKFACSYCGTLPEEKDPVLTAIKFDVCGCFMEIDYNNIDVETEEYDCSCSTGKLYDYGE